MGGNHILLGRVRRFFSNSLGGMAVAAAVSTPAVVGVCGVAVDYAVFSAKGGELQAAADAAALAATRELSLAKPSTSVVQDVARSYVAASLGDDSQDIVTEVEVDSSAGTVQVKVIDHWKPVFAHYFGANITPIVADAKATLVGESKTCVIATSASDEGAISMTKKSSIEAKGCGVYSNSTHQYGIYLEDSSMIDASVVCSAGGIYSRTQMAIANSKVLSDCPPVDDPLIGRVTPSTAGCDYNDLKILNGSTSLRPGVYCGGISISGSAGVNFEPGTYVIKDGSFGVSGFASIKGIDVAFFFTGDSSFIQFSGNATIELSGAESGEMAGLLFFEDPKATGSRLHNIQANNAHTLTGTIYLPKSTLLVDPTAPVGEKSAYTAIVVQRLVVDNGPSLILNSNYSATNVPVPSGIRSTSDVVLTD